MTDILDVMDMVAGQTVFVKEMIARVNRDFTLPLDQVRVGMMGATMKQIDPSILATMTPQQMEQISKFMGKGGGA